MRKKPHRLFSEKTNEQEVTVAEITITSLYSSKNLSGSQQLASRPEGPPSVTCRPQRTVPTSFSTTHVAHLHSTFQPPWSLSAPASMMSPSPGRPALHFPGPQALSQSFHPYPVPSVVTTASGLTGNTL